MDTSSAFAREARKLTTRGTSERVNRIKISPIKEMELLAANMQDVVSLGQGTPSFAAPAHIGRFVAEQIARGAADKYSLGPGIADLRMAIGQKLFQKNGIRSDPGAELLVTVGANEALSISLLTLIEPGDEVVLLSPAYSPHIEQIRLAGGTPVFVPLDERQRWSLDIDLVERAISRRSKAIMINTPANPTGTVISEQDLRRLGALADRHDLFLICDETYEDYVFDGHRHFSVGSISELRHRVLSVFSFSKSYALTGWRCGYIHAEEGLINQLLKIHDALCICAPLTGQYAALAALTGPQDCIADFRGQIEKRRALILERLRALERFQWQLPSGAYYLLARIAGVDDSVEYALRLLREAGVVTVPGAAFGPSGEGCIRMSYCMSEEVIALALDRVEEFEARNRVRLRNP